MAIPYAGVHRKLKDAETPWEKKVGLARFAWVSARCFLPNKEQVLMDWAANSLANASKLSVPDHAVPGLWQFLHDALQSRRLAEMGSRVDSLSLRPSLFPVILKSLRMDSPHVESVIGCCHSLLGYSSLGSVITGTLDHQVQFLSAAVNLLNAYLKTDSGGTPDKLNTLVQRAFASFASLQRQQPNPRKIFTVVCEKLLQPSLTLHQTITSLSDPTEDRYGETLKCIQDLLANGLFNRDLVDSHTKYLRSDPEKVTVEKQREERLLQECIASLWKNMAGKVKNTQEAACSLSYVTGMPVIFRAFLSIHKYPSDVSFPMFRKLCCIMGIMLARHDGKPATGDENPLFGAAEQVQEEMGTRAGHPVPSGMTEKGNDFLGNWTACLPALSELLKIVAQKQIYEVAVDNVAGKPQFKWLCCLAEGLITNANSSSPAWYSCLNTLLDMNHVILEDELTQILKEALYCLDQTSLVEDTQRERNAFLEKLLATYTKLRQFDRVIASMMDACKTATADAVLFSYPMQFSKKFSECVQSSPPGLTLDIWKQFLNEFLTKYLPEINQMSLTTPSPPPRKKYKPSSERSKVNMGGISVTFDLFLRSMRLVDAGLTAPLLRRVGELMGEMRDRLLRPLLHFCTEAKPSEGQVYCTLLLCHVWGDLDLLLSKHASYGGGVSLAATERLALDFGDFSSVHGYGTPDEWKHVCKKFAGRDKIVEIQVALAIQQARALLLRGEVNTAAGQQSLANMATAICDRATNQCNSSLRISLLPTLLENLPLLLPYLPSQQLANLTSLLCKTLMSSQSESKPTNSLPNQPLLLQGTRDERGDTELCRICEEFARSEFCMESRWLQTALVTSVLGQLSKVIGSISTSTGKASVVSVVGQVLQTLSDINVGVTNKEDDVEKRLEGIVCDCNRALSRTDVVKMGGNAGPAFFSSVEGTLKVICFLPLHHLLPSNKVRCMLGLLLIDHALAVSTSSKKLQGGSQRSALLLCQQLEAAILKGVTNKAEFVGDLDGWKILSMLTESFIGTEKKVTKQSEAVLDVDTRLNDITEELLAYWLKRLRQLPNQEAAFKEYSHMVETKLDEFHRHLSRSKNPLQMLVSNLPLLTVSTTLLGSLFASRGSQGSLGSEAARDFARPILELLRGIVGHSHNSSTVPSLLNWLAKAGMICIKFTLRSAKIDSECQSLNDPSEGMSDTSDEMDTMEMGVSSAPVATEKWSDGLNMVLQEISTFFSLSGEKSCEVIGACLSYIQASCQFIGHSCDVSTVGVATSEMWLALLSLMGTRDRWNDSVMNDFRSTLSRIVETMDLVQLKTLLSDLLQDTSPKRETETQRLRLRGALAVWQLLPGCCVSEGTHGALGEIIPQAMLNLLRVLQDAVRDWTLGGAVVLSVLQAVGSFIGEGKELVSADVAMHARHFCLTVPVAKVTTAEFPSVFGAMCQILRSLLIGYPRTVMTSLASYFACLQHLLKAVMQRGQQKSDAADRLSDHDLYMCAENMERLLTMLATYKTDVNKLAVFLVSDYIAELQKGTLRPLFKKTLVTGVYNLLDVCDERAIDFLNANLPHNLREIFKTFYSDFQKYYRYSGKV